MKGSSHPAFEPQQISSSIPNLANRFVCEVWNAMHIEAGSQVRMLFRVYLEDDGMSGHLQTGRIVIARRPIQSV